MRAGRFERAWRIADRVLASRAPGELDRADLPFHLRAVWNGEALAGKDVLVRCYHGLGDSLQFVRYVPELARTARSVTVQATSRLHGLLRTLEGVSELCELPCEPEPRHEVAIESMELPHAFRTTLAIVPADVPYLRADAALAARIRASVADERRLRVGLVVRAGEWDPLRSLALEDLAPLAGVEGVAWYDLGRRPTRSRIPWLVEPPASGDEDGLDVSAAWIEALDLVITVDTMAAHLAGALAAPVWTLLRSDPDWRWMAERPDSPWYPTMRLFRQTRPGDWSEPVEQVAYELRELVARSAGVPRLVVSAAAS